MQPLIKKSVIRLWIVLLFASIGLLASMSRASAAVKVTNIDIYTGIHLEVNGVYSPAPIGSVVTPQPSVIVKDDKTTTFSDVVVTFSDPSVGGSVTGDNTGTSDQNGIATLAGTWTLGSIVGANTLLSSGKITRSSPVMQTTLVVTGYPGTPKNITPYSGNNQSATVNTPLGNDLSVFVTDDNGNPVRNAQVIFEVLSGAGSVIGGPVTVTTNDSGIATLARASNSWTLGTVAGANMLTVSIKDSSPSIATTFTATAVAGAPKTIDIYSGNNQSVTVNSAVGDLSVIVRDEYGNAVGSGVNVTFAVLSGGGTVASGPVTALTNAAGIATLAKATNSWTLGTVAGANTLTASITGSSPATFNATGIPGQPIRMIQYGSYGEALAKPDKTVSSPPTVRVLDAFDNPVSGIDVTFTVTFGSGTLTGGGTTITVGTDQNGLATVGFNNVSTVGWKLGGTIGANTLQATTPGVATGVDFAQTSSVVMGDEYGGGIVVEVDTKGIGYIVSAVDLSAEQWCVTAYRNTTIPTSTLSNADPNTEPVGMTNSKAIILNTNSTTSAALKCRSYTGGNFHDWFLPSKDELAKLFIARDFIIAPGTQKVFWSSSQLTASTAYNLTIKSSPPFMSSGAPVKTNKFLIRAMRRFTF